VDLHHPWIKYGALKGVSLSITWEVGVDLRV